MWEHKVESVIARLSLAAYKAVNYDEKGRKLYKRDRPYSIPDEARQLVACLGMHDRRAAEIRAKEIMMGLRQSRVVIDQTAEKG